MSRDTRRFSLELWCKVDDHNALFDKVPDGNSARLGDRRKGFLIREARRPPAGCGWVCEYTEADAGPPGRPRPPSLQSTPLSQICWNPNVKREAYRADGGTLRYPQCQGPTDLWP